MLSSIPCECDPKFERNGGALTCIRGAPASLRFTAPAHMALVMFNAQPERRFALNGDRPSVGLAPVGSLEIIPASSDFFAEWTVEKHNLVVLIDPCRLARLAGVDFDKKTLELYPPKLGTVDKNAYELACRMRHEIENMDQSCDEYLDALITVFGTHLVRNYSSLYARSPGLPHGGLPPAKWRRVNDFIQGHLSETLTVKRLASIAGLSPSHFMRAFKQTVGQSPHQYVISCRLACARDMIINTDAPLSQVAKAAGFSSNSHMTSLMRRVWHTTPTDYRRRLPYEIRR